MLPLDKKCLNSPWSSWHILAPVYRRSPLAPGSSATAPCGARCATSTTGMRPGWRTAAPAAAPPARQRPRSRREMAQQRLQAGVNGELMPKCIDMHRGLLAGGSPAGPASQQAGHTTQQGRLSALPAAGPAHPPQFCLAATTAARCRTSAASAHLRCLDFLKPG